jgi:large subunit ribosomal protein L5
MYEFVDRLINVALPGCGTSRASPARPSTGRAIHPGIREQIIFPEVNYDQIEKVKGLNITFVTTAKNDEQGLALLRHFGMPFRQ